MIVVDEVVEYPAAMTTAKGLPGRCWSHMFSSLPGVEGHAELEDMARKLRLRPSWLQHRELATEHYDLTPSVRAKAIKLGAVVVNALQFTRARLNGPSAMDVYLKSLTRPVFGE